MSNVHVVSHPLVLHKLSNMRRKETNSSDFRSLLGEIAALIAYEVTRDCEVAPESIETPLQTMQAPFLANSIAIISILRAGNGLLDGILKLIPTAHVGHVGLYRSAETFEPVEYYFKLPPNMPAHDTIVVDPMLATGNSAIAAVERIKLTRPKSLKFVCLLAAPEGVEAMQKAHPDVPIYTAAIDERLNDHKYIVPGLGDAGDRMYGTA